MPDNYLVKQMQDQAALAKVATQQGSLEATTQLRGIPLLLAMRQQKQLRIGTQDQTDAFNVANTAYLASLATYNASKAKYDLEVANYNNASGHYTFERWDSGTGAYVVDPSGNPSTVYAQPSLWTGGLSIDSDGIFTYWQTSGIISVRNKHLYDVISGLALPADPGPAPSFSFTLPANTYSSQLTKANTADQIAAQISQYTDKTQTGTMPTSGPYQGVIANQRQPNMLNK